MNKKKLGLPTVVATGMGMIIATSCLKSLGDGAATMGIPFIIAMGIACLINIFSSLSMAELCTRMPNVTGGIAQYTLAALGPFVALVTMVGGYLVCNLVIAGVETSMFGLSINAAFDTPIPSVIYTVAMIAVLMGTNLLGINVFAKIQDFVAYALIISMVVMGFLGIFGLGTGEQVQQEAVVSTDIGTMIPMISLAFFLFIGSEFVIPMAKDIKKPKRNIPLGMVISLVVILAMQSIVVLGMKNYTPWDILIQQDSPHIFFGSQVLGTIGTVWMVLVSLFAVVSTINSQVSALSYICAGMANTNMLPKVFGKRNRFGAPWFSILVIGGVLITLNVSGISYMGGMVFMILTGCVLWMLSYIVSDVSCIILRKRMGVEKGTFHVPFGPVIPILGIAGNIFMIWNIDGDPTNRMWILIVCGIILAILAIYSAVWIKFKMKRKLFKPYAVEEILEMEKKIDEQYENKESVKNGVPQN